MGMGLGLCCCDPDCTFLLSRGVPIHQDVAIQIHALNLNIGRLALTRWQIANYTNKNGVGPIRCMYRNPDAPNFNNVEPLPQINSTVATSPLMRFIEEEEEEPGTNTGPHWIFERTTATKGNTNDDPIATQLDEGKRYEIKAWIRIMDSVQGSGSIPPYVNLHIIDRLEWSYVSWRHIDEDTGEPMVLWKTTFEFDGLDPVNGPLNPGTLAHVLKLTETITTADCPCLSSTSQFLQDNPYWSGLQMWPVTPLSARLFPNPVPGQNSASQFAQDNITGDWTFANVVLGNPNPVLGVTTEECAQNDGSVADVEVTGAQDSDGWISRMVFAVVGSPLNADDAATSAEFEWEEAVRALDPPQIFRTQVYSNAIIGVSVSYVNIAVYFCPELATENPFDWGYDYLGIPIPGPPVPPVTDTLEVAAFVLSKQGNRVTCTGVLDDYQVHVV